MDKLKEQILSAVNIYKSRNLAKAESICKDLMKANPNVVFLYNLLGLILSDQKKIVDAKKIYEKGIKIDPNFAMIYNNLGLLYKGEGDNDKAAKFYKKSISLNKTIAEPHNNLGTVYNSQNKYKEAIDCYKKAILINPKLPYSHHNLASIYISLGKFEEARKHLNTAIEHLPNFVHAHKSLNRITKYKPGDKHIHELKKIYEDINENDGEGKMNLAFALGKAFEDVKKFDESFSYYNIGNEICRNKINYSYEKEREKFLAIKKIYNKNILEKYKKAGHKDFSPIFIVGMPRSGTTLVEQILSSHPKVFGADEIELVPRLIKENFGKNNLLLFSSGLIDFDIKNLEKLGKDYEQNMRKISDNKERVTDKLPTNFLRIGFIKLILPNSKIIHCQRNAYDNCFSIFKNHFTSNKINYAYNLDEIVDYYNLYLDMMKFWSELIPNFILNIKYENLISAPETQIKNLIKICNLDWNDKCLNFHKNQRLVKTASDVQVRNKIYKTSIESWKNYEKYIKNNLKKLKI